MVEIIDVSARAAAIEYAIRDVVVPAVELEKQGHEIIRMNVGDPLAFDGLPTPKHMISAYKDALTIKKTDMVLHTGSQNYVRLLQYQRTKKAGLAKWTMSM